MRFSFIIRRCIPRDRNKDKLVLVAEYLLEHEKMDSEEFISLMEKGFVEQKINPEITAPAEEENAEVETSEEKGSEQ